MNISIGDIVIAFLTLGVLGTGFAVLLWVSYRFLAVKGDPRLELFMAILPGANCGACGCAGCLGYAESLVEGGAAPTGCLPGGPTVAARLAALLGVEVGAPVIRKAVVHCGADDSVRQRRGQYTGIRSCAAANLHLGGNILCRYGCLGYGDCSRACPFDAIEMVDGLPAIRFDKCVACGKCVAACPRHITSLEVLKNDTNYAVRCSNPEVGRAVRRVCSVGCIACGRCERACPVDAIHVVDNVARFDYEKCTAVGACAKACPTKCITVIGGRIPEMTVRLEAVV